jgi:hypothetical protein
VKLTKKEIERKKGANIKGDPTSIVAVKSYSIAMSNIEVLFSNLFYAWKSHFHFSSQGLQLTRIANNNNKIFGSLFVA